MREVVRVLCGSHLYGTNVAGSDKDYKIIYIPSARDILLGQAKNRCKKEGEDDAEYWSYYRFVELLCQGQTNAIDMMFAPEEFHQRAPTPEWYALKANLPRFLSRNCKAFVGYCRKQAAKYAVRRERYEAFKRVVCMLEMAPPETKVVEDLRVLQFVAESDPLVRWENRPGFDGSDLRHLAVCQTLVPGRASIKEALRTYRTKLADYGERIRAASDLGEADWKSMYHAVRVAREAVELMRSGQVTLPRPERSLLKKIRQGQLPIETVGGLIEQGLEDVERAVADSSLPENPDWEFAEDLVMAVYRNAVRQ